MMGFTEIHSHFVYGVDDGARSRQEMEALLDIAAKNGTSVIYATSHAMPGLRPFDTELYRAHLEEARNYCEQKKYGLTLREGAEILFTPLLAQYAVRRELPTLDRSDTVLVEFAPDTKVSDFRTAAEMLTDNGYKVIFAHVERYTNLHPGESAKLRERYGIRYQMNGNTVIRRRGFLARRKIDRWLKDGLIDFIASDAHNPGYRPFVMDKAWEALRNRTDDATAARLTGIVPPVF